MSDILALDSGAGLFDMALKNLGFLGFFLKNLKSPNLGF